jgi:hypothetical protein
VALAGGLLAACGGGSGARHPLTAAPTLPPTAPAPTTTRPLPPPPPPVAPLTGLLQAKPAQVSAPAVVVKIDNVDAARPQAAINQADLVYEELVEGGLSRLAAVFQSEYPAVVGPVRSGRLTDAAIADDLNHPVFAYSGTNAGFLTILRSQPVTDVDDGNRPDLFWRSAQAAPPHNLYASVVALAAASTTHAPPPALFSFLAPGATFGAAGSASVRQINVNFGATAVTWAWNAAFPAWMRSQDGTADVDQAGVQLRATNLIVQFVPYITSGMATGEGVPPVPIPTGELVGRGPAWYLSGGRVVKGSWSRSALTATTQYTDASGASVRLAPGRTWVELVPVGTTPALLP